MKSQLSTHALGDTHDLVVIGAGMAGLTAATLAAKSGAKPLVLEQNWLPGGCSSTYPRKHYQFESGATTLVGLDEGMPLRFLLDELNLDFDPVKLELPMEVKWADGVSIRRFQDLTSWIAEAERVFGPSNQKAFWTFCYRISQQVWKTSSRQRAFPPSSIQDLLFAARQFRPIQLGGIGLAYLSVWDVLKWYGLDQNDRFVSFVEEQLMITAQNKSKEVNILFGAAALCYTLYGNYYVRGGMIGLINLLVDDLKSRGGDIALRTSVTAITPQQNGYSIDTNGGQIRAKRIISALPLNDTLELWQAPKLEAKWRKRLMQSDQLNGAFSLGFVCKRREVPASLHHQIHLDQPLPEIGAHSIFLSFSHPDDPLRCGPDEWVCSVSTHVADPDHRRIEDSEAIVEAIFQALDHHGLVPREDVTFWHSSTPGSWYKWTKRAFGFVGGYPQFMNIKPWQMADARFDGKGVYLCGDSVYPGQGIPGAALSGIIAWQKMKLDRHFADMTPVASSANIQMS
ncbi:NAD(P)/FAD-dependent oxidoreductase [Pontibacter sp. G13]|uniref:phytoene desaturase family protein n=1 Tax=Pontibacter sp. G13 TaxID=3074898 RepID=UPI00288B8F21|nr:NAD(P)/FAD-dependent oxidoreductase [Pontibacter sp. G13]WNJ17784.1 NAD(P)/FAD-dependent oxidoreductase [Pontibacter sp. G13]